MKDTGCRQPVSSDLRHPHPSHSVLLATTPKRTAPEIGDVVPEGPERPTIRGHRVVREEAGDHRPQPSTLFGNGVMHAAAQLLLYLPKRRPHAVSPCLAMEQERPAPGLATNEREPQEGKGLRFAKPSPLAPHRRVAAKLQQASLRPVKFESELLEPQSHRIPEAPRIGLMLEAGHDIVGIAHEDHVAGGFAPPPLLGPEIEDVV